MLNQRPLLGRPLGSLNDASEGAKQMKFTMRRGFSDEQLCHADLERFGKALDNEDGRIALPSLDTADVRSI
jgi:hypothetical protein